MNNLQQLIKNVQTALILDGLIRENGSLDIDDHDILDEMTRYHWDKLSNETGWTYGQILEVVEEKSIL